MDLSEGRAAPEKVLLTFLGGWGHACSRERRASPEDNSELAFVLGNFPGEDLFF